MDYRINIIQITILVDLAVFFDPGLGGGYPKDTCTGSVSMDRISASGRVENGWNVVMENMENPRHCMPL